MSGTGEKSRQEEFSRSAAGSEGCILSQRLDLLVARPRMTGAVRV